ncbi:AI-2E family transporter [Castellaniella defragrans]|uniref:Membrane protein, putative n=2 Tax=Castellaniella defragrans TaxID=75697 RepID=W8WZ64_CASD6|nr:AI-2E family transporter [Castellaniella defragrans]KAB0618745.1 AI-2E family transporter [Castellaniella defragrans]MBB6082458.1 putative PurR-regulated permease PerM [Castellaniella defragrans]CDM24884.1 membrane protein, putative [Castellaniella defragrans 65Phen]
MPTLHFRSFLLLLAAVSIAFISILLPFYPAIFWGGVLAVIFRPLYRRLLRAVGGNSPSLAAFLTVLCITLIVILPMLFIAGALANEVAGLYTRINSGQLNLGVYYEQIVGALPPSVHGWLDSFGVGDLLSIREKLSTGALQASQFLAKQAVNIGQNTFQFVVGLGIMLYLLFFLLRDGAAIVPKLKRLIPLEDSHRHGLFQKFATVVRATVKGNIVIAATQGLLGGLMFAFLGIQGSLFWGVMMAFLSLLPAVGASLIWVPVAIYFLVTGALWEGVVLILFGVLVIGLLDNLLRPILVGKDTKLPDYVVLISTLGGLSVFGLNGFVIGPLFAALFIACWDLFPDAVAQHQQGLRDIRPTESPDSPPERLPR